MSGAEVALAVVGGVVALALVAVLARLARTLRALQRSVDQLRSETVPLVRELRAAVDDTKLGVTRMNNAVNRAEAISSTVDAASRLAYLAFSNPVIKTMAVGAGTARAARRLRNGGR